MPHALHRAANSFEPMRRGNEKESKSQSRWLPLFA
jgi:hypothetical protein